MRFRTGFRRRFEREIAHLQPIEGDRGIQFEPREDLSEQDREFLAYLLEMAKGKPQRIPHEA